MLKIRNSTSGNRELVLCREQEASGEAKKELNTLGSRLTGMREGLGKINKLDFHYSYIKPGGKMG